MAYLDTLFQLGMDLTRSSTAQKEDHVQAARVAHTARAVQRTHEDRKRDRRERGSVSPAGKRLLIDLHDAERLDDLDHVESTLKRCVEVAGATLLHVHLYRTSPKGAVAGVAVLEGCHIGVHSWPEAGYAAFDVFMCGSGDPHCMVDVLRNAFSAGSVTVREHGRISQPSETRWQATAGRKAPVRLRKTRAAA